MNIVWTLRFRKDFNKISSFYKSVGSLNYPKKLLLKIKDKVYGCLEIFPEMFQKIPEKNYRNLRYFVCDNYRIVYEIKGDFIYILTIIGGNLLKI